jgi:2-dehydropantoate 2-reductase
MTINHVVVLGAGAIGSTYGALLSRVSDVTLVGSKEHVKHIQRFGLELTGEASNNYSLRAIAKINQLLPNTLILLTTKIPQVTTALTDVRPFLRSDSIILALQNGLDIENEILDVVGTGEIIRGITNIAAEFLVPGRVRYWIGETILSNSKSSKEIVQMFTSAGLSTHVSENIHEDIWNKLILNCVTNPLTALLRVSNNQILNPQLEWIRHELIFECVEIARAVGIEITLKPLDIDRKITKYYNLSSMCQDILKKKKTEIDYLNGKIVSLGKKYGIPTPINQTLTDLVKFLEKNPNDPKKL